MSASPSSPLPEDQPDSATQSEPSPTRKRSHSEMVAGQQGARRASPVEISSTHSSSDDTEEDSTKVTSTPSRKNGNHAEEQRETRVQIDNDELDPEQPLEEFDWEELENRYHKAIGQRDKEDEQLYDDFQRLMTFFELWIGTTPRHETDRDFIRLRTRMAHVQNSENELEKKREHYTKVVQAFESALRLLEG